jgi:hypothetical protein
MREHLNFLFSSFSSKNNNNKKRENENMKICNFLQEKKSVRRRDEKRKK